MSRNHTLTGVLVALAMAASACGVGPPASSSTRPTANPAAVYHRFAQCVRDHGQPDFPDPTVDARGHPQFPPAGGQKPSDAIMQDCGPILNQLAPTIRPRNTAPNDPAMMRRFAQCMRAQGIDDWPDPDANGDFHFPPSLSGTAKGGPRSQQISAAWNGPCRQYDPSGRISAA